MSETESDDFKDASCDAHIGIGPRTVRSTVTVLCERLVLKPIQKVPKVEEREDEGRSPKKTLPLLPRNRQTET